MTKFITISTNIKAIVLLIYILVPVLLLSQNNQEECYTSVMADSGIYENSIAGKPFFLSGTYSENEFYNSYWQNGTLIFENGSIVYNKSINYHLLTHKLLWIRPSDRGLIEIDKGTIKEFVIPSNDSEHKSLFRKIKIRKSNIDNPEDEYLQVLSQGTINLYVFRNLAIGINLQKLYPVDKYYFEIEEGKIEQFKPSRRLLFFIAGANKSLMKSIIRSNHFKIRRERDLIKTINLFNLQVKDNDQL